jgi:glutathione S-transferase
MAERMLPTLYSFRRCPYAMRARLALSASRQQCALREIVLRDKPADMIALSPKATVPVLKLLDDTVLEESLDIMHWALGENDPENWLDPELGTLASMKELIAESDGPFKHNLDRYKYAIRYEEGTDPVFHRTEGAAFLEKLNGRLGKHAHLFGDRPCLADFAIFPFVRQFANTDRAWFDAQALIHLQGWLAGHLESERFKSIMTIWPVWAVGDEEPVFPA